MNRPVFALFIVMALWSFSQAKAQAQTQTQTPAQAQAQTPAQARTDSGSVRIEKDPRLDLLVQKQIAINEETTRDSRRNMPGFRIQVINSPDRSKVFATKTRIYQEYPDMKPYVLYQAPNYKLKVGNFKTQEEAEEAQKQLARLFPSGLYIIRDVIEVKPDQIPN